ncbi:MAG: cyclic beta 1-2 glucan synthetase, partial [Burkholderiaceae bacterium]
RDAPIKFAVLNVRNRSGRRRRLSATGYVEWVLGDQRVKTMAHVNTRIDADRGALVARNPYSMDFGDRLAFFAVDDDVDRTMTGDRGEFLGRNGSPDNPAAMAQEQLSGKAGAALDPCAAIRVAFDLDDGQQKEIVFKLGAGSGDDEIRALLQRFKGADAARDALAQVKEYWTHALGAIQVETPDKALDTLANGWLVYQVMASRLWGRTAFYQSSGAFGFRDQLQDVMALVHTEPDLVRAHIVLCASRQYPEGDVQHWWHPPVGRGVRTRCSDDYLWLALASCRYVSATGDASILDEPIHFLKGRPLEPDEESYYELPAQSPDVATLYEHCVRAITHGLRFGAHGLPLMGTGDWNDGMNKVGARGKGESIWLAFFLHEVLRRFRGLAWTRGDVKFVALCEKEAAALGRNLQENGWDGAWFRRAYFDDGSVLGSAENSECQIDSIAQSWSVLSGATSKERMRLAMKAVDERLVQSENAVIKLLAPPFDASVPYPGYIQAYVPGVRENGGQYTHAAVWSVMAFAALHNNQRAWELLSMLNPINHGASVEAAALYKAEPYVVASDVYALAPHAGRGGWTWYSGSAGWLYRLITESVLGIKRRANKLSIEPCVPNDWKSYKISYRFGESVYVITVQQQAGTEVVPRLLLDGIAQDTSFIALVDDGVEHRVQMQLVSQDI